MNTDLLHIVDGQIGGEAVAARGIHRCAVNEGIKSRLILFESINKNYKFKIIKNDRQSIKIQFNILKIYDLILLFFVLKKLIKKTSLVHIHGIWPIYVLMSLLINYKYNKKLFISPHGSFDKWSLNQKKYKKKIGLVLYKKLFKNASGFFVTSNNESISVKKIIESSQDVIKHSLGIDLKQIIREDKSYENKTIILASRLNSKKGVDLIINAFIDLKMKNWNLKIIGPGDNVYLKRLKKIINDNQFTKNIHFLGEMNTNQISEHYQNASFFALPTHSENFGFVIAEALANKLPVLTTVNAPWEAINEYSCGYCIDNNEITLKKYLKKMMSIESKKLKIMGENGFKLIETKYTWKIATKNVIQKYNKELNNRRVN